MSESRRLLMEMYLKLQQCSPEELEFIQETLPKQLESGGASDHIMQLGADMISAVKAGKDLMI